MAGGVKQTLPAIYPARSESLGFKGDRGVLEMREQWSLFKTTENKEGRGKTKGETAWPDFHWPQARE